MLRKGEADFNDIAKKQKGNEKKKTKCWKIRL